MLAHKLLQSQRISLILYVLGESLQVINFLLLLASTIVFTVISVNPHPFEHREERVEDFYALWPCLLMMFIIMSFFTFFKLGMMINFYSRVKKVFSAMLTADPELSDTYVEVGDSEYYVVADVEKSFHETYSSIISLSAILSIGADVVGVVIGTVLLWRCHHNAIIISFVSIMMVFALFHSLISLTNMIYGLKTRYDRLAIESEYDDEKPYETL